jgi:hypothetical protein
VVAALQRVNNMRSSQIPSSSSSYTTTRAITRGPRQRHIWSDKDTKRLIELVGEKNAAWSIIEREHDHEFDHPRNQQAYRDKARNLKVDFLIMDTVLPPAFDLVTLGRKEVEKVLSLGKNPYRKEAEVENGVALNTDI